MQGGGPPGCEVWISSSVTCPVAQASQACSIPAGAGEVSRDLLLGLAWGDMRGQPCRVAGCPRMPEGPVPCLLVSAEGRHSREPRPAIM